jgi:hypothetical protein
MVKHKLITSTAMLLVLGLIAFGWAIRFDSPKDNVAAKTFDFSFTASGDIGATSNSEGTLQAIKNTGSNFHLALGDFSYGQLQPETAWCNFIKSKLGSNFPFELVSGNHDQDGSGQGHVTNFASCLPHRLEPLSGAYGTEYYFDHQNLARIIMISPNVVLNGETYAYNSGSVRLNWLSNSIDSARSAGIPWVIVGMHKNCLSMGTKNCEIGTDLMNLLISKKVDLVLQGHDHNYQRSKQLAHNSSCTSLSENTYNSTCVMDSGNDDRYGKGIGTVFQIIGSGGVGLTNINTSDTEANYFAKYMGANINPTFGVSKFNVSSDEILVQFLRGSGGNFYDNYSIVKEDYAWQPISHSHSSGTALMDPGEAQTITLTARNTGTATWTKNGTYPVKLGTWHPGRNSATQHVNWPSQNRLTGLSEDSVAPGEIGTFSFNVRAPYGGEFFESLNLVAEGHKWFNDPGFLYYLNVRGQFRWEEVSHSHSTNTAINAAGSTITLTLKARNTGNITWKKAGDFPVRLATSRPQNRGSNFYVHGQWLSDTRPAGLTEDTVPPGGVGTFTFQAKMHPVPGQYHEHFSLIAEGYSWFNDPGANWYVDVR